MRVLGCERQVISADEAVRIEPALAHIRPQLAGATFTAEDESGDANQFTRELAKLCEAAGVQFRLGHHITALREVGGSIDHVELTNAEGRFERVRGDAFVLAMGSFSPLLAQPLGIRLPIYPAKGYSVTMPVKDASRAHQVSLTDDEFKLVFSRYTSERGGDRLRIAGTAELNGYDRNLNQVRCDAIVRRVEQLFPGAGDASQAQFWTGLRPATPSNVPLIGQTKVGNLFPQHRPRHAGLDARLRLGLPLTSWNSTMHARASGRTTGIRNCLDADAESASQACLMSSASGELLSR
jgi:D-amino-acid dehydrogenase